MLSWFLETQAVKINFKIGKWLSSRENKDFFPAVIEKTIAFLKNAFFLSSVSLMWISTEPSLSLTFAPKSARGTNAKQKRTSGIFVWRRLKPRVARTADEKAKRNAVCICISLLLLSPSSLPSL